MSNVRCRMSDVWCLPLPSWPEPVFGNEGVGEIISAIVHGGLVAPGLCLEVKDLYIVATVVAKDAAKHVNLVLKCEMALWLRSIKWESLSLLRCWNMSLATALQYIILVNLLNAEQIITCITWSLPDPNLLNLIWPLSVVHVLLAMW